MGKLRSKRYILALVFALAAFGAAFAAVMAGVVPVQWSREQPVLVKGVTLQVLGDDSMRIFEDEALTKEITSGDTLVFEALLAQPPLDKIFGGGAGRELFIRNDSNIPLNLLTGPFEIEIAPGEKVGYKVELAECCNPINPDQVRLFHIGLGVSPAQLDREFPIVIGALGEEGEPPPPLAGFISSGDFHADVGPVTEIDFESLTAEASSCPGVQNGFSANLDNPLVIQGVTFSDSPCLELAIDGQPSDQKILLRAGNGLIELPLDGASKPSSNGALLQIFSFNTSNFEVKATDGSGATLTINGTGDPSNPLFAGFTSGHGITKIEIPGTSASAVVISSFRFETSGP